MIDQFDNSFISIHLLWFKTGAEKYLSGMLK